MHSELTILQHHLNYPSFSTGTENEHRHAHEYNPSPRADGEDGDPEAMHRAIDTKEISSARYAAFSPYHRCLTRTIRSDVDEFQC